jgi:hypothetical protein
MYEVTATKLGDVNITEKKSRLSMNLNPRITVV